MNNKIIILIISPVIFIIILTLIAYFIHIDDTRVRHLEAELLSIDREPLAIALSDLAIEKRTPRDQESYQIKKRFKGPFDFFSTATADHTVPPAAPDAAAPAADDIDVRELSLIVISGDRKMAIIEGSLVREGDSINGMKVSRIEPNRVLLQNKAAHWLYVEERK